jgi:peptidylprolyl isomerase
MRVPAAIGVLCAAVAIAGCGGGGDSSSTRSEKPATAMSKSEIAKLIAPKVATPGEPPPKKLVIKDLREGAGATAKPHDEVLVDDMGINYKTGEVFESTWDAKGRPSKFPLDEVIQGWEEGVPGMKVGGRRELIIPSKAAYGTGPLIFVIDLLAIE